LSGDGEESGAVEVVDGTVQLMEAAEDAVDGVLEVGGTL